MIERSFRLEDSMYEQLKEISDAESLPISYLVRVAISRFLASYNENVRIIEVGKTLDI